MPAAVRQTIRFTGQVQGVGFRVTTTRLAEGLALDGTVRNVADGSVELVVAGESPRIGELVARLKEHFGHGVDAAEVVAEQTLADSPAGAGVRIVG